MQEALHGLSQPLTAISLALTVAAAEIGPTEREQTLQIAQEQCQRAMEAIDELRALVHAEWTRGESLRVGNLQLIKAGGVR